MISIRLGTALCGHRKRRDTCNFVSHIDRNTWSVVVVNSL